jgi:serine protease AprX
MKIRAIIFLLPISFILAGGLRVLDRPVPAVAARGDQAWMDKVDAQVWNSFEDGGGEYLIYLAEQADLRDAAGLKTKIEKTQYVYQRLTSVAAQSQPPVISALKKAGAQYRSFWIVNMILVRGDQSLLEALARRPDVRRVYANPARHFDAPVDEISEPDLGELPVAPEGIEWNLQKVNADDVWALGYTGQGAIIGGQDTGYQWDHPALINSYRGWNGAAADHNYNWHDSIHMDNPNTVPGNPCGFDSSVPCDDQKHGTHTMGIMVGDDGAGNQVGMAPGTRWIGCRNMEEGWGTPATYSECYQWFMVPTDLNGNNPRPDLAPDVINNSWSCPPSEGCTDPQVLLAVVDNLRASGILTVQSAGNSGPSCSSVSSPAAIYAGSFTVGNITSDDTIAPSSSRGPVTIDGSGRLKPDITAPGTGIRSSVPGGGYGVMSGTSMAGPHVAGLVALILSAKPELAGQVDKIESLIQQSALHLGTTELCGATAGEIPNNVYGWGRIDALGAINWALQNIDFYYFPLVSRNY